MTQEVPVSSLDVDESRSSACWSVEERAWKQELPDLPDEVIALLAPPVVVTASAYVEPRAADHTPDGNAERVGDRGSRLLAPAPPLRPGRRAVGRGVPRYAAQIA